MKSRMIGGLAGGMILALAGVASAAGVTVDGKVNASEYTHFWSIAPSSSGPSNMSLYMWQDSNFDLYVGVVLPKDYTDNTYGALNKGDTAGVAGAVAGTSKNWNDAGKSVHEFQSGLAETDSIEGMSMSWTGGSISLGRIDYVADVNKAGTPSWHSAGVSLNSTSIEFSEGSGANAAVAAIESSLGYNFTNYGAAHPTWFGDGKQSPSSASAPLWEYAVMYEMKFKGTSIGKQVLSSVYSDGFVNGFTMSFSKIHSSPSMGGKFENRTPPSGTTPFPPNPAVPLPSSVWMGGLTLAGLIVVRRMRRQTEI